MTADASGDELLKFEGVSKGTEFNFLPVGLEITITISRDLPPQPSPVALPPAG